MNKDIEIRTARIRNTEELRSLFFKLSDDWALSTEEQKALLGVVRPEFTRHFS